MRPHRRPGAALLLLGLLFPSACQQDFDAQGERVPVPPDLQRRWITENPRYSDRFFEVTGETLIFGRGEGDLVAEEILAVFARDGQEGTLYQFRYRASGPETYHFDLIYDPRGETVRFENQPEIVWVPAGD